MRSKRKILTSRNISEKNNLKLSTRNSRSVGSQKRGNSRQGAAAVEFAVIVPVFMLLIIGFMEIGRAMMVQQVITSASRVGARSAAMLNSTESSVLSTTTDYATNASIPGTTVVVSPSPAGAAAGDLMTVTVSIPFEDVSWLSAPWFLGNSTLTASSVMRKEGFE